MATLAVDAGRWLNYERHRGEGRPVVLVHGWGMSSRAWDTVVPALLENGNEVVALDLRCCGASDKDFDDMRIDALAGDVVALAGELGLEGVVLNGWSLGGVVCAQAAEQLGPRAAGLVLTAAPSPRFAAPAAAIEEMVRGLRADRAPKLREIAAANFHAPVDPAWIDWMWQVFLQMSPRAYETMRDLVGRDQSELLAALEPPVLVLAGRHDAFVPLADAALGAELARAGRLVEFAQSGHVPFIEEGELYRRELLAFLNGL